MRRHLAPILVVVLTAAAWASVPFGEFHYDDFPTILTDASTVDTGALIARLAHGVRPLLRLSFFVDHALWGFHPAMWLAENLLLHVACALLVFVLAKRRLADELAALIAALVFALQPASCEVVAYVSGRSTGLMTLLLLAALWLREERRTIPSLVCFVVACLVKEVALVFPALLWIWEATQAGADRRSAAWRAARAPAIAAIAMLLPFAALHRYRTLASYSLHLRNPVASLLVNARALPETLSLWVRPWALTVDHPFDASAPAWLATALGAIAILAAIALAWRARRAAPLLTLAIGWTLLALAPTHSFIAKLDPVTEKPLYLAWIGPSIALGALAARFVSRGLSRGERRGAAVAIGLLLGAATFATAHRLYYWRDARRLWLDATWKAPAKSRCWDDLGMAWFTHDDEPDAARAFRRALVLDPANAAASRNLSRLESMCGARCAD